MRSLLTLESSGDEKVKGGRSRSHARNTFALEPSLAPPAFTHARRRLRRWRAGRRRKAARWRASRCVRVARAPPRPDALVPPRRVSRIGARSLGFLRVADAVAPTPLPSPPTHQLLDESRLDKKYGAKSSDDSIAKNQRNDLIKGVQRGDDATERLDASVSMAQRTDDIGDDILESLQEQREKILSARCSAESMEGDMDISERKMTQMACEKCIQRWVLWVIAALFVGSSSSSLARRAGGARATAPPPSSARSASRTRTVCPRGCADAKAWDWASGIARRTGGGEQQRGGGGAARSGGGLAPSRRGERQGFEEGGARRTRRRRALAR